MLDKAKPTQLFGIPREVLIAYNNGGLDAKIANARRPGDMDKLVWERTMLHLEIARLAHQAAQIYCVGKASAPRSTRSRGRGSAWQTSGCRR